MNLLEIIQLVFIIVISPLLAYYLGYEQGQSDKTYQKEQDA